MAAAVMLCMKELQCSYKAIFVTHWSNKMINGAPLALMGARKNWLRKVEPSLR